MPTAHLTPHKRPTDRAADPVLERELFLTDWDLRFEKTLLVPQADPQPPKQVY